MRYGRWKAHFMIQEHTGLDLWRYPFTKLRAPMIFDLEVDPLEESDGMGYNSGSTIGMFLMGGAQYAKEMLATFKEFPPRQKPGSFTISDASAMLEPGSNINK